MSLTAIVWALLYTGAALATFVNPIFGVLGYLLEYYQRPELRWWGDALPDLRYNFIISVLLGISFLMRRSSLPTLKEVKNPAMMWLCGMVAVMLIVMPTVAVDTAGSFNGAIEFSKMAIIFPLLVVGCLRTRRDFDLFVVVHMIGGFRWGYEAWENPKRAESRLMNVGSGDSLNDNAAAAHLLTVLPFTVIYLLTEKTRWMRAVALVALPFVMNTLVLCNSRGSMIGLAAGLAASMFLVKSGNRFKMVVTAVASVGVLLFLADDQFIQRQKTTTEYEQDNSSQERLASWQGAIRLVKDRPFGAGHKGFVLLSPIYIPDIVAAHGGELRAPHNTWALVASEWGIPGFICYLGTLGSTFVMLRRVKKGAQPEEGGFFYWRALAIQLAMVAYLVSGTFTDRLYAEAGWWMVGLSFALYRLQLTEQAARVPVQQEDPVGQQSAPFGRPSEAYAR